LRGAIDWSYQLLDDHERLVFRRVGVFVGGWRLDDAEAILSAGGVTGDVLNDLDQLLDNSLVRQIETGGEPRFSMLETIREFALEQLAADGELEAATRDHALRFAALAKQAEPELTGGPAWLDRFDADQANLRSALGWLADHQIDDALEMGAALWRFWHRRGHLREGAAVLRALLDRPAAAGPTRARSRALIGLAGVVYWQLDYPAAKQAYEEALAITRTVGDQRLQAEIAYSLVYTDALDGDLTGAQHSADEAHAIYARLGDEAGVDSTLMVNAMLATLRGERERALELMDAVIPKFQRTGNYFGLINTMGMKLRVLVELQRLDEARELDVSYLRTSLEQNELTSVSAALLDAASLEALGGHPERAARLYAAGVRAADDAGGQAPPQLVRRIELMPLLEAKLDEATLAALIAEGRQMAPAAAVGYALEGLA
jgi:hypothetical protein